MVKLRITNESAGGCVSNSVQVCIFIPACVCVCVCIRGCALRSASLEWGAAAAAFGSLWLSVKRGRPCGALLRGPDNASAGLSTLGQSV